MKIFSQIPTNEDSVLITLIKYNGSVPQTLGAKAVVTSAGLHSGTVGGGKVEAKAILKAQELLKDSSALICQTFEWNLTHDVGMTCGGIVTFLFEVFKPKAWSIVVFGAGHVAQELVPLLCKLDCHVTCLDTRAEWIEKLPNLVNLTKNISENMAHEVIRFSSNDYFILMTQGHATDLPILAEIIKRHKPPFIGAIGSKTKALTMRTNLKQLDFNQEQISQVHCPVGLAFGKSTPIEISFSVIAQLLQVRDKINLTKGAFS